MHGVLGVRFIAFAPFVGVAIGVYLFGKISMAHFNPAVTVGYLITGYIRRLIWCIILLLKSLEPYWQAFSSNILLVAKLT
jgi:aquaporin Z